MNVVAQQEPCSSGEVAKCSPAPTQGAAPVQLLDLAFPKASFTADFPKFSCAEDQAAELSHFIGPRQSPALLPVLGSLSADARGT